MLTKTIKLEKGEYTSFDNEFNEHDLIILSGARNAGKSFPCANFTSNKLEKDESKKFAYVRMRDKELATYQGWCQDLNLQSLSKNAYTTKLTRGSPTSGDITLLGYDQEGMLCSNRTIGKCISLEASADYKSGKYDEYEVLVFEEYARLNINPSNERTYVTNFLELVQSIFRNRPKKIFLICNNLKTIPLLDRAVEELTGEVFENPIRIKIFRKSEINKTNKFLAYLNGELYNDDDFIPCIEEFLTLYTNKDFIIKRHKVYPNKFYVMANKTKEEINHMAQDYLKLKFFCVNAAKNEFYYQNTGIEKQFILSYSNTLAEISSYLSVQGWRYF